MGYCSPYCFLEMFVGAQGLDGGRQSHDGDPSSPPNRENPKMRRNYMLSESPLWL